MNPPFTLFTGAFWLLAAGVLHSAPYRSVSYDYPEQPGLEHILKTDTERTLLTNDHVGTDGPNAVWGEWGKKDLAVDWRFDRTVRVQTIKVALLHPTDTDASHAGKLRVYVGDASGTFRPRSDFTTEIPFQAGKTQVVQIALPPGGLVARDLRTVFEARRHQSVISEVSFEAVPAIGQPLSGAESARSSAPEPETAPAPTVRGAITYDYPAQPSLSEILKNDTARALLTDGVETATGPATVWGKWGANEMIVDWTFGAAVRVKVLRVVIAHPNASQNSSHASRLRIYATDENGDFFDEPDYMKEIPFEAGASQTVTVTLPDDGLVASRLRTVFEAARHQVALTEVSFETTAVTAAEAVAAQAGRVGAQPETFVPVAFLPRALSPDARVTGTSIFGVCGHFLHNDFFMPGGGKEKGFSEYWRLEHTLPFLVEGNVSWVREALYRNLFWGADSRRTGNGRTAGENRRKVEDYLQQYQDRGVQVLLAPMFGGGVSAEGFTDFAAWIGRLSKRFSCVRFVELHNEPNLKGFWKGTPQEFVEAARVFAAAVKSEAPESRIVVGSFAGWGGAWQHEDLKELLPGEKEIATRYAEEVFKLGLLDFADGVSAHPYRGQSAPEGGEVLESPKDPEGFAKEIRGWLALVASYRADKPPLPFHLTEIGYSVSKMGYTNVPDEARQADYLSRLMLVLLGVKLDGVPIETVFWYDLKQDERDTSDYESNFGLVSQRNSRVRPAYLAFRRVTEFFADDADLRSMIPTRVPTFSNGANLIKSYVWQRPSDGALIVPFWRMNQLQKKDVDFDSELTLTLPEGFTVGGVSLHDLNEDRPRSTGYTVERGVLRVPLHVTARASWLVLESTR